MIKPGSLTASPKVQISFAPQPDSSNGSNRTIVYGSTGAVAKAVQSQPVMPPAPVPSLNFDPISMLSANWAGFQGMLAGLNLSPSVSKQSNPFMEKIQEAQTADVDPETGKTRQSSSQSPRPVFNSSRQHFLLDEDPFAERFDRVI